MTHSQLCNLLCAETPCKVVRVTCNSAILIQAAQCICQFLCARDVLLILDDVWREELPKLSSSVLSKVSQNSSRWLITSRNVKQTLFNPEPVTLVLHNDDEVLRNILRFSIKAPDAFWVR